MGACRPRRLRPRTSSREERGYAVSGRGVATRSMHEFIMGARPSRDVSVDHINRNRLDNRRGNLRWATRRQQAANRSISASRLCGIRPYDTKSKGKRYRAVYCGRHLGTFASEAGAIKARRKAVQSDGHIAGFYAGQL